MSEVITTMASSIFVDDHGLLRIVSNGTPSTASTIKETFTAAHNLMGRPVPTLFDARKWPSGGSDFWVSFIDGLSSVVSAGAMLIEPSGEAVLGGFPSAVNRLMVPFEVFTDENEAVEFLLRFHGKNIDPST